MATTTIPRQPLAAVDMRESRLRSLIRGRLDDPAWARPLLLALLALTAIAYIIAHDIESMSRRVERKFVPDAQARPEINLAFPPGLAVSYEQIADGFERA